MMKLPTGAVPTFYEHFKSRGLHIDPADMLLLGEQRHRSAAESQALLMFDLQRGMR